MDFSQWQSGYSSIFINKKALAKLEISRSDIIR
jgi:hypothetical protein